MHHKDRPANKQLSPKDAMQAPTYVSGKEESYHDETSHKCKCKQKHGFSAKNLYAKAELSKFHRSSPTRDTIWPWMLCHGF